MAGDWIKMRVGLVTHPKVLLMAELLIENGRFLEWSDLSYCVAGYPPPSDSDAKRERHAALRVTRYVTVTALLRFWGYANEHAKGEHIECLNHDDVDEIAGFPGFAEAMEDIGWCVFGDRGGVDLPGFLEHNTSADARRSAGAERQKAYRDRQKEKAKNVTSRVTPALRITRDVTSHAREEKRREDSNTPHTPQGVGFDRFWSAWPASRRKAGKPQCIAKWHTRGCERIADQIVAAVEASKHSEDWLKDGGQYIPAPLTWLNQARWEAPVNGTSVIDDLTARAM